MAVPNVEWRAIPPHVARQLARTMRRRRYWQSLWVIVSLTAVGLCVGFAAVIRHNTRAAELANQRELNRTDADSAQTPTTSVAAGQPSSLTAVQPRRRSKKPPTAAPRHFLPEIDFSDSFDSSLVVQESRPHIAAPDRLADDLLHAPLTQPIPSEAYPGATSHTGALTETTESGPVGAPLRYHLVLPAGGGKGSPLIIFLHGTGGVRAVWNRWAAVAQSRGYIVCMPASSGTGAGDPKSGNRGNDSARRWAEVDAPKLRKLAQDLIQSLGADSSRVAVFGYSNGAFFAQTTGLRYPDLFSAVVSIGGGCNVVQFPPGTRDVGVYMIHGTADRAVPVEVARKSVERLKTAGISDVVLKEYPDRGHELFEEEMPAVFEWLETRRAN